MCSTKVRSLFYVFAIQVQLRLMGKCNKSIQHLYMWRYLPEIQKCTGGVWTSLKQLQIITRLIEIVLPEMNFYHQTNWGLRETRRPCFLLLRPILFVLEFMIMPPRKNIKRKADGWNSFPASPLSSPPSRISILHFFLLFSEEVTQSNNYHQCSC